MASTLHLVREGDVVLCHSMDRLDRHLDDLRKLDSGLTKRGIQVRFVKESLPSPGSLAVGEPSLKCDGAFAQCEREMIRERQREGIEQAKRAERFLSPERAAELTRRLEAGEGPQLLVDLVSGP